MSDKFVAQPLTDTEELRPEIRSEETVREPVMTTVPVPEGITSVVVVTVAAVHVPLAQEKSVLGLVPRHPAGAGTFTGGAIGPGATGVKGSSYNGMPGAQLVCVH